jgi:hypothetical protein
MKEAGLYFAGGEKNLKSIYRYAILTEGEPA